jgi:2-keto-4-pentenoate hydratase
VTPPVDVAAIARALHEAADRGEPASIDGVEPLTVQEGYAVQEAVVDERRADEGPVTGYKLGFTNEAIQREIGVEEPAYGRLLNATVGVERIRRSALIDPRVEPEIAVRLDRRVPAAADRATVESAIGAVMAAIEVVDSRTGTWSLDPGVAIADNALAARLATGPEREPDELPPLADVEITLSGPDGDHTGRGAAALGDPLAAVAWLSRARPEPLPAGTLVSTGSLTETVPIRAGEPVTATSPSLGTVRLDVT